MEKYKISKSRPEWAPAYTSQDLLKLSADTEESLKSKNNGKAVCYSKKTIINTSETSNDEYNLMIWSLHTSDSLQAASMRDIPLHKNESLEIHQVSIIRNGNFEDRTSDLSVKEIDDEQQSNQGFLSNNKKINIQVKNLNLNDIIIIEFTTKADFEENDTLDKEFFRYIHAVPNPYFFYVDYEFKLIQNRKLPIRATKRYFGDSENNSFLIEQGGDFLFKLQDYQTKTDDQSYYPLIEIATESAWGDISNKLTQLYKENLAYDVPDSIFQKTFRIHDDMPINEKIQGVIEFVQDEIVYLYDTDIMHGHVPQSITRTIESGKGDCKAKSLLLISLMKKIGVDAELILVNFGLDYFIESYMPSPFIFNHAIVKITLDGKDYFVDPTTANKSGALENRGEPFFSNYLSVKENSILSKKQFRKMSGFNIEDKILISIKKKNAYIEVNTTYRLESADMMRSTFRNFDIHKLLNAEKERLLFSMYDSKREGKESTIQEAEYRINEDDKRANQLKTYYKAKLSNYFIEENKQKVFKYFSYLPWNNISNFKHKEHLCSSFSGYPIKTDVTIMSDYFIDFRYTFSNIFKIYNVIKNNYFEFSNTRFVYFRKSVNKSEFMPKTYGYIEKKDLDRVKKDYAKIQSGGLDGIGFVFQSPFRYLIQKFWLFVVIGWFIYVHNL